MDRRSQDNGRDDQGAAKVNRGRSEAASRSSYWQPGWPLQPGSRGSESKDRRDDRRRKRLSQQGHLRERWRNRYRTDDRTGLRTGNQPMIFRRHSDTYGASGPHLGPMIAARGRWATVKAMPIEVGA